MSNATNFEHYLSNSSAPAAAPLLRRALYKQAHVQAAKLGALVSTYAQSLSEISNDMQQRRPRDLVARLGAQVSDYLGRAAHYLSESDGSVLVEDVEAFTIARPVVAVAAAVALGFASARIVKVSSL